MTDELRAAAELVAAKPLCRCGKVGCKFEAADRVVAAWMAEHPADDGEAVTGTWLFSLGFRPAWGHPYSFNANGIDVRCTAGELVLASRTDELWVHDQPTRGAVRRLLAALAVPLTSPPEATA